MWRSRNRRVSTDELKAKEISTLIQVANVSEQGKVFEIHLTMDFLDHYPSGRLNRKKHLLSIIKNDIPILYHQFHLRKVFDIIDENHDGTIEFNELLASIVLMSRLHDLETKLAFAFDMWDESGDGLIDQSDLADVISAIYDCAEITDRTGDQDPKKRAKSIIDQLDQSGNGKLSKQELIKGCQNDPVLRRLLASGS